MALPQDAGQVAARGVELERDGAGEGAEAAGLGAHGHLEAAVAQPRAARPARIASTVAVSAARS